MDFPDWQRLAEGLTALSADALLLCWWDDKLPADLDAARWPPALPPMR
jgi:hypothetical protein